MTLRGLLCVGAGGFLGAIARYGLALFVDARLESAFPFATLLINVTGSFVLGTLSGALEFATWPPEVRLALGVGFLGAYTTFSTFGAETIVLLEEGSVGLAVVYVGGSVILGLLATAGGLAVGRSLA